MKRILLAAGLTAAALAMTACGSSGSSAQSDGGGTTGGGTSTSPSTSSGPLSTKPGSVTIGSAAFSENELLADIYGDAMTAKGVTVTKKLNIGERGVYLTALQDGGIGAIPEYNGSLLAFFDKTATAKSTADVNAALATQLASKGLVAADSAAAEDKDTITVTKATASKDKLTSIADLKSQASSLTLGAPPQFKTRADGVPALASVYGVTFGRFVPTAAGGTATVNALKGGSIDAADIFSTDPAIAKNGFVSLTDPKNMFAAQNITPIFSRKVLTQPMKDAVDAVSAKLDTATLASLVAKVDANNADSVAQAWLKSQGLIK